MRTSVDEDDGGVKSYNLTGDRGYLALKRQHLVFLLVLSLLAIVFFWHYLQEQIFVGNDLTINTQVAVDSPLSVNPNTATWEELSLLPGIGPAKAKAIVEYRQDFITRQGGKPFQTPNDLTRISGIGPKTVEAMKSNLIFD